MRTVEEIIADGMALHRAKRYPEAVQIFDKLLGLMDEPDYRVLLTYGTILSQDGHYGLAKHLMMQAVNMDVPYAYGWYNLGVTLARLDRADGAKAAFKEALRLDPNCAEAMDGMAARYVNEGEPEKCEKWARRALKLKPDYASSHNHLALSLMEQERFEEAWPHWEYRHELDERSMSRRSYPGVKWDGNKVNTLVIHGEQGLGDEILFLSVLDRVRPFAKHIILECAPRLVPLLERSFGLPCYGTEAEVKTFHKHIDAWIPMGSLFGLVGLPTGKPYLKARAKPKPSERPLIGLAWKGGMQRTHKNKRTLKLEQLRPILETPGLDFINLQYGGDDIVREGESHGLITPEDRTFDGLVSWIQACDLVITPCQTNVHIAGALGKPCWVLTPKACAWRYAGTTERMFSYDSVRLFRQRDGDWPDVVAAIATELRAYFA